MTQRGPLSTERRENNLGGAALKRGAQGKWELADVVAYNSATHTALVRTHGGRPLPDVPQLRPGANDFDHLRVGTTVAIHYELGFPVICGVLNLPGPPQDVIAAPTITGVTSIGDGNPLQPTAGSSNYRPPAAPSDMTQGDWARVGALGNHVAVLEGGIASLGSPNALVRSLGLIGLLQLVAKQTQTITDFGEWKVINDQGRTSFRLRAGSNQTTQTGLDEEHWSIRLDLGATGDLFDFQITEPQGKTLFKLHVGADGRVQLYGDAGVDISTGPNGDQEQHSDILGSRTVSVGNDDTVAVGGNRSVTVAKALAENITTDKQTSVGNNDTLFVNKDTTRSTGGNKTEIVAGGPAQDAKSGATAYTTKILNGGWKVDIGNAGDGANISAQAAYELTTSLGDITFNAGMGYTVNAKQKIVLKSNVGVSVGDATDAWPLFDTYRRAETQMNQKLGAFLSSIASIWTSAMAPLAIPVIGGTLASPILAPIGPLILQMQAAYQTFEGSAATYLSKKNKND